jgi:hypothetical protein
MVATPLHWHYRRYDGAVHPLNAGQFFVQKSAATSDITKERIALSGVRFKDMIEVVKRGVDFLRPRPMIKAAGVIAGNHNPADRKNVVADEKAGALPHEIELAESMSVPKDAVAAAPGPNAPRTDYKAQDGADLAR